MEFLRKIRNKPEEVRKKILFIAGSALVFLALIPTFLLYLNKQVTGEYGQNGKNFFNQPLYPLITVATIIVIFILAPVVLYKKYKNP